MSEPKSPGPASPETKAAEPKQEVPVLAYPLGAVGAVFGAAAGVLVMKLGADSGFYAELAIGILSGLGAGWLAKRGGWGVGAIAGLVTAVAGVWAEWKFGWRWNADSSLEYFVKHLGELPGFRLLIHAVGVAAAVWLAARQ